MNTLIIVLRLIHIIGGAFWFGSILLLVFFIVPSIRATAETGQKFLSYFLTKTLFGRVLGLSAILTSLAGASLYWIDSRGFASGWMTSGPGWGFGIGGIFGIIALIVGNRFGSNLMVLGETALQIQGSPTPEQMDKIQVAQKQLGVLVPISTFALIIALICMATARYWRF